MYKRIILKLSGEALASKSSGYYNDEVIDSIINQIKEIKEMGTQISLVVGGGNYWRGRSADKKMDRTKADHIGILATVMNALYLCDALRQAGVYAHVMTPFKVGTITEEFSKDAALSFLSKGEVVIFAGGIGHPFFSTDSITALRGAELEADALFFAKNVDGIYDKDPNVFSDAKKMDIIKCEDIIKNNLKVIDLTAASICLDEKIPILIFGLNEEKSIIRGVKGEKIGTLVTI
ncbi:MAG: UMP kinase [Lachnospiraceae bacterium]|nr:UMP kinase [Lachnospiraceae bacterium]